MEGMFDLYTDAMFLYSTYKTVNYMVQYGVTVYQYLLTYEGERSFSELFGVDPVGVCHGDDMFYLWDPVYGIGNLTGRISN